VLHPTAASSVGATSEQREHAQQNAASRLIADALLFLWLNHWKKFCNTFSLDKKKM